MKKPNCPKCKKIKYVNTLGTGTARNPEMFYGCSRCKKDFFVPKK